MGILDKFFGPPSKDKFASLFRDALLEAGDRRTSEYDADDFRLVFSSGEEELGVLNLANLYLEFCKISKSDRKKSLKEMVRMALSHLKEMPKQFEEAKYDLLPRIWPRSTVELLNLRQKVEGGKPLDWPVEPVGDHLYLSFVFDLPESVRSISNEDLVSWDISFWEAREVAMQNLSELKFVYANVGDQLFASSTGDSYDATRMMMTHMFDEIDIPGRPIAMVPNRDTLLVTGTESIVGQKMMLEFAEQQLNEQPRPMVATPLMLEMDGTWIDWQPELDHPLFQQYNKLRLGWLQVEYNEQKQLLEKLYTRELNEDFIASFSIASKDDNFHSFAVWSKGVPTLMPETDVIALFEADTDKSTLLANGPELQRRLAHLMEPMDLYPPRFRVAEFPSSKDLDGLETVKLSE